MMNKMTRWTGLDKSVGAGGNNLLHVVGMKTKHHILCAPHTNDMNRKQIIMRPTSLFVFIMYNDVSEQVAPDIHKLKVRRY